MYRPSSSSRGSRSGIRSASFRWSSTKVVKDTLYPLAIFQRTEMVGFTSPFSIWASMLRETPVSSAAASSVSFLLSRMALAFTATVLVISIVIPS